MFYGITADRDLLPDADVLGQCLTEALDELLDADRGTRRRGPARAPHHPDQAATRS